LRGPEPDPVKSPVRDPVRSPVQGFGYVPVSDPVYDLIHGRLQILLQVQ